MKVIKRDGRLQEFDLGKIKTSLICAADTAKLQLNESDIKIILEDIKKLLVETRGEDGNVSSMEIVGAIVAVLKKDEFNELAKTFVSYKK